MLTVSSELSDAVEYVEDADEASGLVGSDKLPRFKGMIAGTS